MTISGASEVQFDYNNISMFYFNQFYYAFTTLTQQYTVQNKLVPNDIRIT